MGLLGQKGSKGKMVFTVKTQVTSMKQVGTCSIFVVTHPEYHQLCTAAGFPYNVELQG